MIDIVVWDEDEATFVANAMKPANVTKVNLKGDKATVVVPEDQLSIAIGKSGQNVRLAGKLTGFELDIESDKPRAAAQPPKPTDETSAKAGALAPEETRQEVASKPVVQKIKKKSD